MTKLYIIPMLGHFRLMLDIPYYGGETMLHHKLYHNPLTIQGIPTSPYKLTIPYTLQEHLLQRVKVFK